VIRPTVKEHPTHRQLLIGAPYLAEARLRASWWALSGKPRSVGTQEFDIAPLDRPQPADRPVMRGTTTVPPVRPRPVAGLSRSTPERAVAKRFE